MFVLICHTTEKNFIIIKVLVILFIIKLFPQVNKFKDYQNIITFLHLYWDTLFTIQLTCPAVIQIFENFSRNSRASEQ